MELTEKRKIGDADLTDNKYDIDFPETGDWNWKTVKLITPNDPYYNGHKIIGLAGLYLSLSPAWEVTGLRIVLHSLLYYR